MSGYLPEFSGQPGGGRYDSDDVNEGTAFLRRVVVLHQNAVIDGRLTPTLTEFNSDLETTNIFWPDGPEADTFGGYADDAKRELAEQGRITSLRIAAALLFFEAERLYPDLNAKAQTLLPELFEAACQERELLTADAELDTSRCKPIANLPAL